MVSRKGIVIHITSGASDDWQMALRNILNLYQDESLSTAPDTITVVVNGPAVEHLLADAPDADKVAQMTGAGVTVAACRNSLDRFGHAPEDLAPGVDRVDSGVVAVVRRQQRDDSYLKLP